MHFNIIEERMDITVQTEIYSYDVLHKCFYWYSNDFIVEIEKYDESQTIIHLTSKNDKSFFANNKSLINKIKNDLIDFKTRDVVIKETKNIRDLLIAKAFAPIDDFDQDPPGNL